MFGWKASWNDSTELYDTLEVEMEGWRELAKQRGAWRDHWCDRALKAEAKLVIRRQSRAEAWRDRAIKAEAKLAEIDGTHGRQEQTG